MHLRSDSANESRRGSPRGGEEGQGDAIRVPAIGGSSSFRQYDGVSALSVASRTPTDVW